MLELKLTYDENILHIRRYETRQEKHLNDNNFFKNSNKENINMETELRFLKKFY